MKKHIFWIVPVVLYLFVGYLDTTTPYFNRTWFNVQHVIFFGVIVYLLLLALFLVYHFFIKKYVKTKPIKMSLALLLSSVAVVGTIVVSNLQLGYISAYEVPHISECSYYDGYGNIIYQDLIEICPELKNVDATENSLEFTVHEVFNGRIYEPYSVDDGVGYIYYDGTISADIEVEVTYRGPYIDSLTYTLRQKTTNDNNATIDGYMFKHRMEINYDIDNQVTVTYTTHEHNIDMTDIEEFPSFDTIKPVIKKNISTHTIEQVVIGGNEVGREINLITLEEVTYDEVDTEIITTFAYGQYETMNDRLFTIDFYENNVFIGDTTDYYFDYNEINIKNSQEKRQSAGVDRDYEIRTLNFIANPVEIHGEDDIYGEAFLFSEFNAELNAPWAWEYDRNHQVIMINGEPFIQDDEYYQKIVVTEYGMRIEEYYVKQFNLENIFNDDSENEIFNNSYWLSSITGNPTKDLLDAYDYRVTMEYPGILSQYHFYQHNFLLEYLFINNYDKFEK